MSMKFRSEGARESVCADDAPEAAFVASTRAPRGRADDLRRERDPDVLEPHLADAARYPGGHTSELCLPGSEAAVAALLAEERPVLVVGAQSSLTGGATPRGEVLLSTARLDGIGPWTSHSVDCGPGVVLRRLDEEAAARDLWFPPVPTYDGATVGGVVATDAAGAATFKYGTVRAWVDGLTVVLACGEVLDLERGGVRAHPDGWFDLRLLSGEVRRVPLPRVARPDVPKVSAGYRGGAGMDLVDLFVGSEGTLGVVTGVRLRLAGPRPSVLAVLVPVAGDAEAIALTTALRTEAQRTRAAGDASGADVSAIEYMDERAVGILREDGVPARVGVSIPADARALLLVQVELPPGFDRERAMAEIASLEAPGAGPAYATGEEHASGETARGPVATLCRILADHDVLADAVPALPGEDARRRALFALREAVPEGTNARVREAARRDPAVSKSGGDVIVPFARLADSLRWYREICAAEGLESVVWGHISDGNLHPNVLARDAAEMERARRAQVAIGLAAIELGGSPLAEHGTGRSPVKKALLAALHGTDGVASMRAAKRALDPSGQLAPGVLFDAEDALDSAAPGEDASPAAAESAEKSSR